MEIDAAKAAIGTLLLLTTILLFPTFSSISVHANPSATIFIRENGTIEPSTAAISTFDNVTYTQIGDIYEQIEIERENIVFDGADKVIQGFGTGIGIHIFSKSNVTVRNTQIQTFQYGIYLDDCSSSAVVGNRVTNNAQGINIDTCENDTVATNYVRNSQTQPGAGIWFFYSQYSNVTNNTVVDSPDTGIHLRYSSNITVRGNTLLNNVYGLRLAYAYNCTFLENQIGYSSQLAASLFYSRDNVFFHNNFIFNALQTDVSPAGYGNAWDDGYPFGGNHWTDYNGTDANMDGLGDTAYAINEDNVDRYPFVNPVIVSEFPSTPMLALFILAGSIAFVVGKTRARAR